MLNYLVKVAVLNCIEVYFNIEQFIRPCWRQQKSNSETTYKKVCIHKCSRVASNAHSSTTHMYRKWVRNVQWSRFRWHQHIGSNEWNCIQQLIYTLQSDKISAQVSHCGWLAKNRLGYSILEYQCCTLSVAGKLDPRIWYQMFHSDDPNYQLSIQVLKTTKLI